MTREIMYLRENEQENGEHCIMQYLVNFSPSNAVQVIISNMRWAGYEAYMEEIINKYKGLVGNTKRKDHLHLRETECEDVK
jgi:hypothetical protein